MLGPCKLALPWLCPQAYCTSADMVYAMMFRKVYANLTCQLKVAEVKSEEAWHARYEAGLASWRTLRTQHAVRLFNESLAGEWAEPQPYLVIYQHLSQQQESAFQVCMLHMPVEVYMCQPITCFACHDVCYQDGQPGVGPGAG